MQKNDRLGTKRLIAWVVMAALIMGFVPSLALSPATAEESEPIVNLGDEVDDELELGAQAVSVSNPRVVADSSMRSGEAVVWDCIWFGSYPQTEVTAADSAYTSLQNAAWDANGDATVGGVKYRRLDSDTVTYPGFWPSGSPQYRYFKYGPVKWRVLEVSGNTALVVSDVALDNQAYNTLIQNVTWKTSSLRSWLNGYQASENQPGINYSSNNFISTAFSSAEKSALVSSNIENKNNSVYDTVGGDSTNDKVFLLCESDISGNNAGRYGFAKSWQTLDEARFCQATDYAHAMGAYVSDEGRFDGNCWWWLRTPGTTSMFAEFVSYEGWVSRYGYMINQGDCDAVRPALRLNLASSAVRAAGTVSCNSNVTPSFADVSDSTAHSADIEWLATSGISKGWSMPDGTVQFRPYANVARADMAAFLFRLAKGWGVVNDSWQPTSTSSFSDVNSKTAHYREIMWLAETGISKGWTMKDGSVEFRPFANVARADMAAFLFRLAAMQGQPDESWQPSGTFLFSDVSDVTAHYREIMWLAENGISKGWNMGGGVVEFRPYSNVARADMAAFLHRL